MNQTPAAFFMRLLRHFVSRNDIRGIFFVPRNDKPGMFSAPSYNVRGIFSVPRHDMRRIFSAPRNDKCTRRARIEKQIFRREKGRLIERCQLMGKISKIGG